MGRGAQRHFFTVLPAEGTIGPCWRQVTWKLGGFVGLQNRRAGVAAVCMGPQAVAVACAEVAGGSCKLRRLITVHAAKAKPSLVVGRVMVASAASLSHLLHQDASVLSTHTHFPVEK